MLYILECCDFQLFTCAYLKGDRTQQIFSKIGVFKEFVWELTAIYALYWCYVLEGAVFWKIWDKSIFSTILGKEAKFLDTFRAYLGAQELV